MTRLPPDVRCRLAVRPFVAEEPGPVVVACSGGPDSMALADAAIREAERFRTSVTVVAVDHGLQPGSAQVAWQVAEWAEAAGVAGEVVTVAVGREGGPENAARIARYDALIELAARVQASVVLLGHTRDDQAETVLLGLARGAGARSLAGMPRTFLSRGVAFARPLLELPRELVRAAAADRGLPVWEDPQNADSAFARARVRHDAMPALVRALGPVVPEALARSARLLRDDADALDQWAVRVYEAASDPAGLAIELLRSEPAAVRRRVLRQFAVDHGASPGALRSTHLFGLDILLSRRGRPVPLPGGVSVARHNLHLVAEPTETNGSRT